MGPSAGVQVIALSNIGRPGFAQWEVHLIDVDGHPWYCIGHYLLVPSLSTPSTPYEVRGDLTGCSTIEQARQLVPEGFPFQLRRHPSFEWPDTMIEAWL